MTVLQMYQLWSNNPLSLILCICPAVDLCNSLYLLHKEASFIVHVIMKFYSFIKKTKYIIWRQMEGSRKKYYMVWGKADPEKKEK